MIQKKVFQILMIPFALLYGIGMSFRNFLYSRNILKSFEFNLPVISVGNLSMGGDGKTPHIEYLVRLLQPYLSVGILSRGYNRKSRGFRSVGVNSTVEETGDEPKLFKSKYPEVEVAVSESRSLGIPQMLKLNSDLQVILLDDAFQHRSVQPGLNILLTSWQRPFFRDYMLPAGRLREWRNAYKRADVIIITKCPAAMGAEEADQVISNLRPSTAQKVYFTCYDYHHPYYFFGPSKRLRLDEQTDVILICGIAQNEYLLDYLTSTVNNIRFLEFSDHHNYSSYDMGRLHEAFSSLESSNKIILTTEKDAPRLEKHAHFLFEKQLPIYILPISVRFLHENQKFDHLIRQFLLNFKI